MKVLFIFLSLFMPLAEAYSKSDHTWLVEAENIVLQGKAAQDLLNILDGKEHRLIDCRKASLQILNPTANANKLETVRCNIRTKAKFSNNQIKFSSKFGIRTNGEIAKLIYNSVSTKPDSPNQFVEGSITVGMELVPSITYPEGGFRKIYTLIINLADR